MFIILPLQSTFACVSQLEPPSSQAPRETEQRHYPMLPREKVRVREAKCPLQFSQLVSPKPSPLVPSPLPFPCTEPLRALLEVRLDSTAHPGPLSMLGKGGPDGFTRRGYCRAWDSPQG